MPANLYESVCVPDLGDFLGYQSANNSVATSDNKSPATPASSTSSSTSGSRNSTSQNSGIQTLTNFSTLSSRSYDGKSSLL